MAELKTLQDFYDPTKAGVQALSMMQMQQHLALQQNNQAMQAKNMEVDNARQAYLTSNPMESYPAAKKLFELNGLPTPDVNTFYANPSMYDNLLKHEPGSPEHATALDTWLKTDPRSRATVEKEVGSLNAFRGAQNVAVQAGIGGDEQTAEFIRQSSPAQTQVFNAIAQSPLQKAKADLIQQKVDENNKVAANVNRQLSTLIPSTKALGLSIERSTPHVDKLELLQQDYNKALKSHGLVTAGNIKTERMTLDPELREFNERRQQSIPKLKQSLQQIEEQQSQLEARAELIARGVAPLQDGESLDVLAATVDDASRQRALMQAQLAFAEKPSKANLSALQTIKAQMDETVASLSARKSSSQESLDLHRAGLDERIAEHTRKNAYQDNVVKAQIELAQGGSQGQAAAIAKKYSVKVDDILPALKDPNNPGVVVKMPGTTEEAGKFSMIDNAVKNIDQVSKAITKPDGSIDRAKVFASQFNLPFTEGRDLNSMMEDAISAKLRAETGAAANAEEVKSISRRFNMSALDKDEVIKSKLSRLRRFLDETRIIRDSSGKIREAAGKGARNAPDSAPSKGKLSPQEQSELDMLRKKYGR